MRIKATQLCQCGHTAAAHTIGVFNVCDDTDIAFLEEVQMESGVCHTCNVNCGKFELPNLDFIEYMAKEQGLI